MSFPLFLSLIAADSQKRSYNKICVIYFTSFVALRAHFNKISCSFKGAHFPKCWAICDASDGNTLLLSIEKIKANKYCRGILKFNVSE